MWEYYYPDYLYHHGTKGMKWGRRLYQRKDGSLTPLGKIRYSVDGDFKKDADRERALIKARAARAAKKQAAEEAKKREEEEARLAVEAQAKKEHIIKYGTAEDLLKIKDQLTPAEMQATQTRIQWEANMQKNITDYGKSKTDLYFEKMDKNVKRAETGIKAYNTIANVINAFNGDKLMPKIETNITNGNKQDIKNRRKELRDEKKAKTPLPDAQEVLKNIKDYDNDTLNALKSRKDTEDNFKKAFEEKTKTPTPEEVLKNPRDYTDAQVKAAADLKLNLDSLDDSKKGKGGGMSKSDIKAMINDMLDERLS